ncbi:helix-turn-helix domain-containing protein [Nonomuraea basaltis]|nr:helix-turn-helix domain-containing protein [Nonomuraea basaltis]
MSQIPGQGALQVTLVVRVRIVLDAAHGYSSNAIARRRGVHVDTVRLWRGRYDSERGVASLTDRQRLGRPPRITSLQRAQITALACQLPAETGVPLSRWSSGELAREAVARGLAAAISASTVRRILAQNALKPWQHQSWIFIRDPDFAAKAARVLDLYARRWDDRPLAGDEYVISADEKTSIQAHADLPGLPTPGIPSGPGPELYDEAALDAWRARALPSPTPSVVRRKWICRHRWLAEWTMSWLTCPRNWLTSCRRAPPGVVAPRTLAPCSAMSASSAFTRALDSAA